MKNHYTEDKIINLLDQCLTAKNGEIERLREVSQKIFYAINGAQYVAVYPTYIQVWNGGITVNVYNIFNFKGIDCWTMNEQELNKQEDKILYIANQMDKHVYE